MHNPQRESFVIQVITTRGEGSEDIYHSSSNSISLQKKLIPQFFAMKLFHRFRKIMMRIVFSFPSRGSSGQASDQRGGCDKPDQPKNSCSSYYSSYSHYNEAISDCIEFFNKSSQEEWFSDGRKSDAMV